MLHIIDNNSPLSTETSSKRSKDIVLFTDDLAIYTWLHKTVQHASITEKLILKLKQISKTIPTWILLIEIIKPTKDILNFVKDMLKYIYMAQKCLWIVIPNHLIHNLDSTIQRIKYFNENYHYLLPGILVQLTFHVSVDLVNVEKKQDKENINESLICNKDDQYFKFLNQFKEFELFKYCFSKIEVISPPPSSSLLHYSNTTLEDIFHIQQSDSNTYQGDNTNDSLLIKRLVLPSSAITFIIGKKGSSIAHIRQESNSTIKIYDDKRQTEITGSQSLQVVTVSGRKASIDRALSLIEEKLALWRRHHPLASL